MIAIILALFIALPAVAITGATITGQQEELCDLMEGTYMEGEANECPDGKFFFLRQHLKDEVKLREFEDT